MTNAIIVAAGQSKLDRYLGHPKCLTKIGKETILDRQIRLLREFDIQDIYVAIGNQGEKIINHVMTNDLNVLPVPVNWWWAEQNRHYGSFYSTWQLREYWEDTIVLLGDIVFSKQALPDMFYADLPPEEVVMLGDLDRLTVGIRMTKKGAEWLKSLPQPYWLTINPNKPYPVHDMSHTALWWHFQWLNQQKTGSPTAPYFCPAGYIEDIDDVKDLTDDNIVAMLD